MYQKKIYTRRIRLDGDKKKFFISFWDVSSHYLEIEVSEAVYEQFTEFEHEDNHYHYINRKYLERFELSEEILSSRMTKERASLEDLIEREVLSRDVDAALASLSVIQRRRFLTYVDEGLSCREIAKRENVSLYAVKDSISWAKKSLKKYLKNVYRNDSP